MKTFLRSKYSRSREFRKSNCIHNSKLLVGLGFLVLFLLSQYTAIKIVSLCFLCDVLKLKCCSFSCEFYHSYIFSEENVVWNAIAPICIWWWWCGGTVCSTRWNAYILCQFILRNCRKKGTMGFWFLLSNVAMLILWWCH